MSTPVGTTLSHYRILEEIGSGGMGVVFLARDIRLDRTVAIKFLSDELSRDPTAKSRFLREARAISRFDHPNICSVHEIDEAADGRVFIVMSHYQGATLDRHMGPGPLPVGEAVGIATQVAQGLAKAHAAGIVHRDIKPTNIMLTSDGMIKILDFGLAKIVDTTSLSTTGQLLGTPAYMSPELYQGVDPSPAADIWSTGVLLHVLLSGRLPFEGDSPPATMYAIMNREPEPLAVVAPRVPSELDEIVRRCLEKDPRRRYADGDQLADALRGFLRRLYADFGGPASGEIPNVARAALDIHVSSHAHGRRRRTAALVGIPIAGLAIWAVSVVAGRREPLRVAVPVPEVIAVADSAEAQLASSIIQSALLRGLAGFKGIDVVDPYELALAAKNPAGIAATVSADEVIMGSVDAGPGEWNVSLRWTTRNNTVRWTDEFSVPRDDPLILANVLITRLKSAYPRLSRRGGTRPITLSPRDYAAYLSLYRSVQFRAPVQFDEKFRAFDELHRRAPGFPDAYLLDAEYSLYAYQVSSNPAHLKRGEWAAEQAHGLASDDPRPVEQALHAALLSENLDAAARKLNDLKWLNSGDIDYYGALLDERRGHVDEALSRLRHLTERRPSVANLRLLVDMEYRNGRILPARRHLDGLIQRFPDDPFAYSKLAQLELLYGSTERADSMYGEVLRRTPTSPPALNNRGLARMLLRRYQAALSDFRSAFVQNSKKAVYMLNVADCEALMGQADSAAVHYSRVLELGHGDPSPSSLMWRAQSLAHLGRKQEALAATEEGLRLEPDNSERFYQASLVYTLVGDRESALLNARRAVDKGVNSRWFSLAWFDPLRSDSTFVRILTSRPKA